MKKLFHARCFTAVLFVIVIGLMCLLGARSFARGVYFVSKALAQGEAAGPEYIELHYNNDFPGKNIWVTLNGGVQRLAGVRRIKDLLRLDNGQILSLTERADMGGHADALLAFSRRMEERGIPVVYVSTLTKADRAGKMLPPGIEDFSNDNADRFLRSLRERGMDCLDLRDLEDENTEHYGQFFRTDLHWTPETGFLAFTEIDRWLTQRNAELSVPARCTDREQYRFTVYPSFFFGSAGRQLGPLYTGKDDFTVIEPLFDTALLLTGEGVEPAREGSFSETLLYPELLREKDQFSMSMYSVYCGGEFSWLSARHLPEETTPDTNGKTLLMLGDSFSQVVMPFFALGYDRVDLIDLRLFDADLTTYIDECRPDLILVMYAPHSLSETSLFRFS